MALNELAENGTDIDVLRETTQHVAQHLMDLDVETIYRADYGNRSA